MVVVSCIRAPGWGRAADSPHPCAPAGLSDSWHRDHSDGRVAACHELSKDGGTHGAIIDEQYKWQFLEPFLKAICGQAGAS
jgi:hypothetical protein